MFPVFCKTGGNLSRQKETLTEYTDIYIIKNNWFSPIVVYDKTTRNEQSST